MGQLTPQHSKLKPVNWHIYLLVWANFARNWTCHLQRNYTGPFQALKTLFGSKLQAGGITGLLSAPLVLRIGDWLCILPAITLVVDKSKKVNKAASLDWLVVNRYIHKMKGFSNGLPSWRSEGPCTVQYIEFDTFDSFDMSKKLSNSTVLCMQCCIKATNTTFDSFHLSNMSNNENC